MPRKQWFDHTNIPWFTMWWEKNGIMVKYHGHSTKRKQLLHKGGKPCR